MTTDPNDPTIPIIPLPGSEDWRDGYEFGEQLSARFPDQDGYDFAYAVKYNGAPDEVTRSTIADLEMLQQGANDEGDWTWRVTLDSGAVWIATGGCDYTGWDCQSNLTWERQAIETTGAEVPAGDPCPFTLPEGAVARRRPRAGMEQFEVLFANRRGASVVRGDFTYGGPVLWELAVLSADGDLDYTTIITSDVLGWLTEADVSAQLAAIAALPVDIRALEAGD